jgi:hypothetical protein
MILSIMNDLPGYEVTEVIGEVSGMTVRSRLAAREPWVAMEAQRTAATAGPWVPAAWPARPTGLAARPAG